VNFKATSVPRVAFVRINTNTESVHLDVDVNVEQLGNTGNIGKSIFNKELKHKRRRTLTRRLQVQPAAAAPLTGACATYLNFIGSVVIGG